MLKSRKKEILILKSRKITKKMFTNKKKCCILSSMGDVYMGL